MLCSVTAHKPSWKMAFIEYHKVILLSRSCRVSPPIDLSLFTQPKLSRAVTCDSVDDVWVLETQLRSFPTDNSAMSQKLSMSVWSFSLYQASITGLPWHQKLYWKPLKPSSLTCDVFLLWGRRSTIKYRKHLMSMEKCEWTIESESWVSRTIKAMCFTFHSFHVGLFVLGICYWLISS